MLAIVAAWAIAVCVDSGRFKSIDLDFALIRALIIAEHFAAEADCLVIELDDLRLQDFIFFK